MFAISTNRGVTSCFVVHASSFIGTPLSAYSKRLANRSRKVSLKFSNKSESTFTSAKARNSSYRGHNRAFTPKIVTSELYAASGPSLQVGDDVRIKSDYFNKDGKDGFVRGTVVDVRAGGWYSIEVDGNISKKEGVVFNEFQTILAPTMTFQIVNQRVTCQVRIENKVLESLRRQILIKSSI